MHGLFEPIGFAFGVRGRWSGAVATLSGQETEHRQACDKPPHREMTSHYMYSWFGAPEGDGQAPRNNVHGSKPNAENQDREEATPRT